MNASVKLFGNYSAFQIGPLFVLMGYGCATLLSFSQAPQPSIYNAVAAIVFFSLFSASLGSVSIDGPLNVLRVSWPIWIPLIIVSGAAGGFCGGGQPVGSDVFNYLGTLSAAVMLVITGANFRRINDSHLVMRSVVIVFVAIGCVNAAIAFVQVFHPPTQDGGLIAMSHDIGRAIGNLRQPNQLASLLLWATASCVVWLEAKPRYRVVIVTVMALLVAADALTASRTGMLGMLLLVLWGVFAKRLSRTSRYALMATPVFYVAAFIAARLWGAIGSQSITRMALQGDASTHRLELWKEAGTLIWQNPIFGVGFGQFNFAWTLTPFPNRPAELFDNAHNILVQLAVEIGLPLTLVIVACLAMAAIKIVRQIRRPDSSVELSAVGFMLAIIFLHSLLEFPLWYPHFLMPTALLAGWAVAGDAAPGSVLRRRRWMAIPGLLCACGAVFALLDYQRVSALYSPDNVDIPLQGRLMVASKSVLFSHHADYALATLTEKPELTAPEIGRVAHVMLDARLMVAWTKALQAQHDMERARYLVERMREFHGLNNLASDKIYVDFLAACDAAPKTPDNPCLPSTRPLTWRDFQDYPLH